MSLLVSWDASACLLSSTGGGAAVRQKLIISEHFEDLFNNILEARRYEKNFFFYHDPESLRECVNYINKVVEISNQLKEESLEMVSQMVTIHNAQLELVGLTKSGGASVEAYSRLIEVGDYYSDRHIEVKTRLEEVSDFEGFIARESGHDLLAFSMGKKSLINLFFPRDWVGRFVSTCQSSVLVLR